MENNIEVTEVPYVDSMEEAYELAGWLNTGGFGELIDPHKFMKCIPVAILSSSEKITPAPDMLCAKIYGENDTCVSVFSVDLLEKEMQSLTADNHELTDWGQDSDYILASVLFSLTGAQAESVLRSISFDWSGMHTALVLPASIGKHLLDDTNDKLLVPQAGDHSNMPESFLLSVPLQGELIDVLKLQTKILSECMGIGGVSVIQSSDDFMVLSFFGFRDQLQSVLDKINSCFGELVVQESDIDSEVPEEEPPQET